MISYVILGLALLVAVILLARWFAVAEPRHLATAVRWVGAVLVGAVALYLLFSRQLGLAMMAAAFLIPLFMRFLRMRALYNRLRSMSGPTPGQSSAVETEFLRMTLDHDSGEMDGEVRGGGFAGRRLSEMSLEELVALLAECRAGDAESATVLEAYLDRAHGEAWREVGDAGARPGPDEFAAKAMTRKQAYEILGLKPGASDDEIKDSHRRLMMKIHPDHGGSTYLAAKINQAKEVLLGRR